MQLDLPAWGLPAVYLDFYWQVSDPFESWRCLIGLDSDRVRHNSILAPAPLLFVGASCGGGCCRHVIAQLNLQTEDDERKWYDRECDEMKV